MSLPILLSCSSPNTIYALSIKKSGRLKGDEDIPLISYSEFYEIQL
jgi:hypothetical protein